VSPTSLVTQIAQIDAYDSDMFHFKLEYFQKIQIFSSILYYRILVVSKFVFRAAGQK